MVRATREEKRVIREDRELEERREMSLCGDPGKDYDNVWRCYVCPWAIK